MSNEVTTLAPHELRALAVAAEVHPRTAAKVLAGRPTRAMQRDRVLRELRKQGREDLIPVPSKGGRR